MSSYIFLPLFGWNNTSAENGCGADDADETTGGGIGADKLVTNGGGNPECDAAEEVGCNDDMETGRGGGVGRVSVEFGAGESCALFELEKNRKTKYF